MKRKSFKPDPLEIVVVIGIIVILLAIVFAFIHEYKTYIDSGTVVDKHYTSPYSTYQRVGKVLIYQEHQGRYYITIRGSKDEEMIDYTFEVDDITYHRYNVGQQYP